MVGGSTPSVQKGVGVAHYVNVSWEKTFKLISSSKPWPKFSPCKSDTSQALSPDLLKKIPAIGIHTEKGLCHKLYRISLPNLRFRIRIFFNSYQSQSSKAPVYVEESFQAGPAIRKVWIRKLLILNVTASITLLPLEGKWGYIIPKNDSPPLRAFSTKWEFSLYFLFHLDFIFSRFKISTKQLHDCF